jgi:hypothetical protein
MTDMTDPARLLQRAWSVVRLDTIRSFVDETIERLRQLSPQQLLDRPVPDAECFDTNPIGQAWRICSDELRAESGMPNREPAHSVCTSLVRLRQATDPEWYAQYEEALGRYRRAAARDLDAWLSALPGAQGDKMATQGLSSSRVSAGRGFSA